MYKVFNETLLTDMGRTKVRKYLKTTDAQAVWKVYSKYMTTSSKGASQKRKITHYLTNTMLDNQFRGTTQQFVLYFNEQFRRQDDLTDISERMPESIKMAHLQNAVKDIPQQTEVCYLLEVSWQMCHAWITHWTIARAILTMSRRRSTHDERTHGRDAREPLLARM